MKCKNCETEENVDFMGMCKKCYEDSIIINEKDDKDENQIKKEEKEETRFNLKEFLKENYLKVETILAVLFAICIIAICIITKNYENLLTDYSALESKYTQSKSDLDKFKEKVSGKDKEISKLKQEDTVKELENKIKQLNSDKTSLQSQKDILNAEISTLKEDVVKIKGEPKIYPAGQLIAGVDVPVGKHKIFGGNSNFIVYSKYGSLKVNIILGGREVNEYVYTFEEGDEIKANSSFKLVALE